MAEEGKNMKPKVVLIAATTANGFIARDSARLPTWSSEDYDFFVGFCKRAGNVVMGRKTWDVIPRDRKPLSGRFALIFTRKTDDKENVPGHVEYWNKSPKEAVEYLETIGFSTVCLIGGSELNALFLKAGLVDELYLTVEPNLWGQGVSLISATDSIDLKLRLLETKSLSTNSLLLHYSIEK